MKAFTKRYEQALDIAEEMVGMARSSTLHAPWIPVRPARTGVIATSRWRPWKFVRNAIREGVKGAPAPVAKSDPDKLIHLRGDVNMLALSTLDLVSRWTTRHTRAV